MALSFEQYYDSNPIAAWDQQNWTVFDPAIDVAFRTSALFSPLCAWVPYGTKAPVIVTGREALAGHVNHNPIGLRQKFITAAYTDSRSRKLRADQRFGAKVQYDKYDDLINMWQAGGTGGFISGILRQHLNRSIVETQEKLSRDGMINNAVIKTYGGAATDFAGLLGNSDFAFDIGVLRDVKLRLSVRVNFSMGEYGDYANPVPGSNDYLVITTPGVMADLDSNQEGEWQRALRTQQDARIINGGVVRFRGWTFAESWNACLFNAGPLVKQVAVTAPIVAGDGALDPDVGAIDNVWFVGQSSSGITHYVQCTDLGTSLFKVGDFVSLHIARTAANGITDGVNALDGKTMVLEVQSVDESLERLAFRSPVMDDFVEGLTYTSLNGGGVTAATAYAFVTKAAHVHPAFMIGARGGLSFAIRQPIEIHTPAPIDDFESVYRVSWDMYGGMNSWNPDLYELVYVRGSFGNRGAVAL